MNKLILGSIYNKIISEIVLLLYPSDEVAWVYQDGVFEYDEYQ